jgi:3-hydroxyisobutyrate dehydrogenase-like beta-hydroxyacid dehydrogenase
MNEAPWCRIVSSSHETEWAEHDSLPTVAILYPGELGSTIGRLLARFGFTVLTTVEERSERTRRLAEEAGLSLLNGLGEVAERADIVLSTVSPAAALPVAQDYLLSRLKTGRPQLYVDLNSTSPATARQLEQAIRSKGLDFVDGAVHGLASGLPERGTLYLSGAAAQRLADVFGRVLRIMVVGREAGQASTFKMMISGLAKGVVALFTEMSLAARKAGLLDEFLTCSHQAYPGILDLVQRLLPTYPRHALRRAEEAREVELTIQALGLRPCLATGAREWAEELVQGGLRGGSGTNAIPCDSVPELIESFAARRVLELPKNEEAHNPVFASPDRGAETTQRPCSPISLA